MDDARTRQTLDNLADLFLTGTAPAGRPPARRAAHPAPKRDGNGYAGQDDTDDAPRQRDAAARGHDEDSDPPTNAASPRRLPPKTPTVVVDPYARQDERTSTPPGLRLTGYAESSAARSHVKADAGDDAAAMPMAIEPQVEAVFLGNLPGFGGPWLSQYAYRLAAQRGPVAILHTDDKSVDIELIGSRERPAPKVDRKARDLIETLAALAFDVDQPVRTFLVHLGGMEAGDDAKRARAFTRWTVCCGADDAAVVSAYRMIKRLVEGDPDGPDANANLNIGMMVMGCEEHRALAASKKLNAAAASFLRHPVELVGSQKQMAPISLDVVGSFSLSSTDPQGQPAPGWDELCAFLAELTGLGAVDDELPADFEPMADDDQDFDDSRDQNMIDTEPTATRYEQRPIVSDEEREALVGELPADMPRRKPLRQSIQDDGATQRRQAEAAGTRAVTSSVAEPEDVDAFDEFDDEDDAQRAAGDEPDLAALLIRTAIPGGIGLEARCPNHPNAQLLLDDSGCLHVLARHQSANDGGDGMASLRSALVDLMDMREWAAEHIDLLRLTQRQCIFDVDSEPQLHLFTDDVKTGVGLVHRLGSMLKLHLLQDVHIGNQSTWYCTELN